MSTLSVSREGSSVQNKYYEAAKSLGICSLQMPIYNFRMELGVLFALLVGHAMHAGCL